VTFATTARFASAAAAASYADQVLADSPVAYWRLGEASGTTMVDSSGNGRDGTYTNSPTLGVTGLIAGDSDTCVDFDGTNVGNAGDDAAWDSTEVTVEAWINADVSQKMIVTRWANSNLGECWALDTFGAGGKARFYGSNTSGSSVVATGSTTLSTGTTYHVAGTYNSSDKKFRVYVNGSLEGTSSALSGTWANESNNISITVGRRQDSGLTQWNGRLDEIAVYDTRLSEARISAHYDAGT